MPLHDASAATDFELSLERTVSRAEALEAGDSSMRDTQRTQSIRDEIELLENNRDLVRSADRKLLGGDEPQPGSGERENSRYVARIEPATGTVAVHDKELGVDQHTATDTAVKLDGSSGGARSPEQASDGLSASFAAAKIARAWVSTSLLVGLIGNVAAHKDWLEAPQPCRLEAKRYQVSMRD